MWRHHSDFPEVGKGDHYFERPPEVAPDASVLRGLYRERDGAYEAPLPAPSERRRIREAAGLTQADVAERIGISRHAVRLYERPAGYRNGRRLPGREPIYEVRQLYSELLRALL